VPKGGWSGHVWNDVKNSFQHDADDYWNRKKEETMALMEVEEAKGRLEHRGIVMYPSKLQDQPNLPNESSTFLKLKNEEEVEKEVEEESSMTSNGQQTKIQSFVEDVQPTQRTIFEEDEEFEKKLYHSSISGGLMFVKPEPRVRKLIPSLMFDPTFQSKLTLLPENEMKSVDKRKSPIKFIFKT